MNEITWIKLSTRLPDNKKIKQIRTLPNGDTLVLLWVFLLCLAGETNDDGQIYLTKEVPYTDEMLSTQFGIDINTVRLGIKTFTQFGMLENVNDILMVTNWEKHQATDKMNEIRAYNRIAQQKHRDKKRELCESTKKIENVNDMSMTCQPCHETEVEVEVDIDKDIDIDIDIEGGKERKERPPTAAEVSEYCREIGANIDSDKFVNYYSERNWTIGNKPIDWKAQVKKWAETEYPGKRNIIKHFHNPTPAELDENERRLAERLAATYGQTVEEVATWLRK